MALPSLPLATDTSEKSPAGAVEVDLDVRVADPEFFREFPVSLPVEVVAIDEILRRAGEGLDRASKDIRGDLGDERVPAVRVLRDEKGLELFNIGEPAPPVLPNVVAGDIQCDPPKPGSRGRVGGVFAP